MSITRRLVALDAFVLLGVPSVLPAPQRPNQDTQAPRTTQQPPPLYGTHLMAITGKPFGAAAGSMMFQQGGNAIDAACTMLAAVATMWDRLGWVE